MKIELLGQKKYKILSWVWSLVETVGSDELSRLRAGCTFSKIIIYREKNNLEFSWAASLILIDGRRPD